MSGHVTIRPLRIDDAAAMTDVLGSSELYIHIGGEPPTEGELTARYTRQTAGVSPDGSQEWTNWIVLADGETVAGYVQASRPIGAATAEIAWVIGVPWQGRGYATTAAAALRVTDLAARGVDEVVADIHPANWASEGVARSIGMSATDEVVDGEVRWVGRTQVQGHAGNS